MGRTIPLLILWGAMGAMFNAARLPGVPEDGPRPPRGNPSYAEDVFVAGTRAYVVCGLAGLWVLDVRDPFHPQEIGHTYTGGYAQGIWVQEPYVYVADGYRGLCVVDARDPAQPRIMGRCDTPGWAHCLFVENGLAYVADGWGRLRIIDLSDPLHPREVGYDHTPDAPGWAQTIWVAQGRGYICCRGGSLRVYDISDEVPVEQMTAYSWEGAGMAICVNESRAYIADGFVGVRVLDMADPMQPQGSQVHDTPGYAHGIRINGPFAYVADGPAGLRVLTVNGPGSLEEIGHCETPAWAKGVYVHGDQAYVADWGAGLRIIDLLDPRQPREVGSWLQQGAPVPSARTELIPQPTMLQRSTEEEVQELWEAIDAHPDTALPYLEDLPELEPEMEEGPRRKRVQLSREQVKWRFWALRRLGDVGTGEFEDILHEQARRLEELGEDDAAERTRLTAERIRIRTEEPERYAEHMMTWLDTPIPRGAAEMEWKKACLRAFEGVRVLGILKRKEAVPLLMAKYFKSELLHADWKFFLVRALAMIGDERTLPLLHDEVTNYLPGSFLDAGYPLEPGEPDIGVVYWQLRTQGMSQEERMAELVRAMKEEWPTRAEGFLKLQGEAGVEAFLSILEEPTEDPDSRRAKLNALKSLGRMRAREAVPALTRIALDPGENEKVRSASIAELAKIRDPAAVPTLIQAAREGPTLLRDTAIYFLWEIGNPGAEEVLIESLRGDESYLWSRAAQALQRCGSPKALPALRQRLESVTDPNVRATIEATIRILEGKNHL